MTKRLTAHRLVNAIHIDAQIDAARRRLDAAAMLCAAVLDSGTRDPTWHETQELENASLDLGRLLLKHEGRR